MHLLADPQVWLSFLTLTVLEIVLGIDNVIFLSILVDRLPKRQRRSARILGLGFAMLTRIALLFSITWLATLRAPLFSLLGLQTATGVELLNEATSESYWERSDRFDMALDLSPNGRGLTALCDVISRWLAHLLAINVVVEPVAELQNLPWNWYVGLSSEATQIGDAIWRGESVTEAMRAQLIGLLRLSFRDPADMIEKVRGEPVHLLLAMAHVGGVEIDKLDEVTARRPQGGLGVLLHAAPDEQHLRRGEPVQR